METPHLPGQPVPVLGHSQSKKVFPDVFTEPAVFQFVPIAQTGPATGHHLKGPGSIGFAPSLQLLTYINKIPSHPSLP